MRFTLLTFCMMLALAAGASQPGDHITNAIDEAYRQAKETIKRDTKMGNDMVTTVQYIVPGTGKTTETLHFFFKTIETKLYSGDDKVEASYYFPLYYVVSTRKVRLTPLREEYLFDPSTERLIFAHVQELDERGAVVDCRFYFHDGAVYSVQGETTPPVMDSVVMFRAQDLKHAFDNLIRNPKE